MNNALVEKGRTLKRVGIVVCGSSVAVFLPLLRTLSHRGIAEIVIELLFVCWLLDLALGLWFMVRGNKLMQQGSESNG